MKAFTLIGLSALPGLLWTSSTIMVTDKIGGRSGTPATAASPQSGPIYQQFAAANHATAAYRLSSLAVSEQDPVGHDLLILLQTLCDHAARADLELTENNRWALHRLRSYCRPLPGISQTGPMQGTSALVLETLHQSESQLDCREAMQMALSIAGVSANPFEVRAAVQYLARGSCPGGVMLGAPNGDSASLGPAASLAAELAFCGVSSFCQADAPYTLYVCSSRASCKPGYGLEQILKASSEPETYAMASRFWKMLRRPVPGAQCVSGESEHCGSATVSIF